MQAAAAGHRVRVVSDRESRALPRDTSRRYQFNVPEHWRSPVAKSPHAADAEHQVLTWLEGLGCTPEETARASRFDAAGYVGIPFPSLPYESTVRIAKYLSMWLLWDDVQVECLENRWRIEAAHVLARRPPSEMTRFDEGWWQLFREFGERRSRVWIQDVCRAMEIWNEAAVKEALAIQRYRQLGTRPSFEEQMEMRIATIGMYATVYLLEDAYDSELPRAFHADPTVLRIKRLANQIVGLGNDIFSFGKDLKEGQINLTSTLMAEADIGAGEALERLIRMHDAALTEYDELASRVVGWGSEIDEVIVRWLQDVRYASFGFTSWESGAPRYTRHAVVSEGAVIVPTFSYFK